MALLVLHQVCSYRLDDTRLSVLSGFALDLVCAIDNRFLASTNEIVRKISDRMFAAIVGNSDATVATMICTLCVLWL